MGTDACCRRTITVFCDQQYLVASWNNNTDDQIWGQCDEHVTIMLMAECIVWVLFELQQDKIAFHELNQYWDEMQL